MNQLPKNPLSHDCISSVQSQASELIALVRSGDYDRFLAIQLAPKAKRAALYALTAFHVEIARIAQTVSEPLIGHIRLAWWRERVEESVAGNAPRNHPVMLALAPLLDENPALGVELVRMLEARAVDFDDSLVVEEAPWLAYCDDTAGALHRAWALVLDSDAATAHALEIAQQARDVAMIGLVRAIPLMAARGWVRFPEARLTAHGVTTLQPSAALNALVEAIATQLAFNNVGEDVTKSLLPLSGIASIHRYYMRGLQKCGYDPYQLSPKKLSKAWQIVKLNYL